MSAPADRLPLVGLAGPALALGCLATGTDCLLASAAAVGAVALTALLPAPGPDPARVPAALGRWLPRAFGPAQLAVVLLGARAAGSADPAAFASLVLGLGVYGTTFGINVAHELIHAHKRHDRLLGGLLLSMVCTGSFQVEHLRGHHRDVATAADPASAPAGRSLYAHLPQAVLGNWRKGWALETARLRRQGRSLAGHGLLRWAACSAALVALAGLLWGPAAAAFVLLQGLVARITLEVVNYVEHYGLRRARRADGRPVPVGPAHSWSSEHRLSRALLLNLPRHADHHAHAARPWTALRPHPAGPVLPAGTGAMVLLALVPPLWFRVMDPWLAAQQAGARPAAYSSRKAGRPV